MPMGKRVRLHTIRVDRRAGVNTSILWILSAFFLAGALGGGWCAGLIPSTSYMQPFLDHMTAGGEGTSLRQELWTVFRWPMAILLLRHLPWWGITIPTTVFLRGYFLSYGIVTITTGSAAHGYLWAVILYGPICFLTIPVFFLLASGALTRNKQASSIVLSSNAMILCMAALTLCVAVNAAIVPRILTILLRGLLSGG